MDIQTIGVIGLSAIGVTSLLALGGIHIACTFNGRTARLSDLIILPLICIALIAVLTW